MISGLDLYILTVVKRECIDVRAIFVEEIAVWAGISVPGASSSPGWQCTLGLTFSCGPTASAVAGVGSRPTDRLSKGFRQETLSIQEPLTHPFGRVQAKLAHPVPPEELIFIPTLAP